MSARREVWTHDGYRWADQRQTLYVDVDDERFVDGVLITQPTVIITRDALAGLLHQAGWSYEGVVS